MPHNFFYVFRKKIESTLDFKSKRKTIEEAMEKHEIWAFTDTKCQVDKKISFKWNTLFQTFQKKVFHVFIQDDASTKHRKRHIQEYCQVWETLGSTQKYSFTMSKCDRVDD